MVLAELTLAQQIAEFFSDIFSVEFWPARWNCGKWSDFHGWLYIISELMIWSAYFAIPFLLFRLIISRSDLPFPRVFWLFIAFIFLCGSTHLMDAIIFWWPAYRLSALIKFVTGIVSLFTVYALYKIIPLVRNLRTASQLEAEIDQRKFAEAESHRQQLELERTRELLKVKDDFINLASHELRTPLTSLRGYLQIAGDVRFDGSATGRNFIGKANEQAERITNLIDVLFTVSNIQIGDFKMNYEEIDVVDLLQQCKERAMLRNGKDINLTSPATLFITADPEKITQVVENLLENAFKYSPGKDVINIAVEANNDNVRISVQDFGIGISEEKLPKIFNRYYRVENTGQNFSGMGLGLYLSSEIIKKHNGSIGVESRINEGSTFWFTIPINGIVQSGDLTEVAPESL